MTRAAGIRASVAGVLAGLAGTSRGETPGRAVPAADRLADILDIKPPLELDGAYGPLFWLLAVLAVAALGAALYAVRRRRRGTAAKAMPAVPPEPAHVRALRRMDELGRDPDADAKGFYFRLSAIFRGYVETRFGIDALEMTSEELLPRIAGLRLPEDLTRGVREFTLASDPVKFSDRLVDGERLRRDLEFMRTFVTRTAVSDGGGTRPATAQREDGSGPEPPRLPAPPG